MIDKGRVFKLEGEKAWVEFETSQACAQCGACARAKSGKMVNEAENTIGARVGDTVEVEMSQVVITLFPLIAYGLPVLFLFSGMILGSFHSEKAAIVLGLLFLALGFAAARIADRIVSKSKKFRSKIIRKIS